MEHKLDWKYIDSVVGGTNYFEKNMCNAQCEDNEHAIRTIRNYRKDNEDYAEFMRYVGRRAKQDKFFRTHYNDTEDDIEERYEKNNYIKRTRRANGYK